MAPLTRGMLFRGGPLLRGRAGWLFMPCGHTKKGRNTPPLCVQYTKRGGVLRPFFGYNVQAEWWLVKRAVYGAWLA